MPKSDPPVSERRLAANRANAQKSTGPRTPEGKARSSRNAVKHGFAASSFTVVRLEDIQEIAKLKEDAVSCYRPVNSQELFAVERIAIAQQQILRGARVESGLFTAAMNSCLDGSGAPVHFLEPLMIGVDPPAEVTRAQNRNFIAGEGFRRTAQESNVWSLLLRYKAQAEREYRRAIEDFDRLKALRDEFPNEPNVGIEPAEPEEVMSRPELNPNVDWNQFESNVANPNGAQEQPALPHRSPNGVSGALPQVS